ncbi:MAG: hypothetical protein EPO08_17825 [Rhodospirillaceae bacterium]|nr:MAG: hypothetical protein EPO08_17825 [Rhodospirillaceae bacterium]
MSAPSHPIAMKWAILSGIEANHTGTGRFMQHLQAAILERGLLDGTIIYSPAGQALLPEALMLLGKVPHLVVVHPQMLGVHETMRLMQERAAKGYKTRFYLLDSFFFCLRSYNHLDHETAPCLRCLGPDRDDQAVLNGCRPWPMQDAFSSTFMTGLQSLVRVGAVILCAQNHEQISLARRHFGSGAFIEHVGLWCADWTDYVKIFSANGCAEGDLADESPEFDVVYHGSRDIAKGIAWVLAVAARTPELRYLIPIDRGAVNVIAPPNVTVASMRWETGLHAAVRSARLALAPSLWSSPCEGALIKNILVAKASAVVDIPTAFSSEVPADVVLRLPQSPDHAATSIREALVEPWRPRSDARLAWVDAFRNFNESVASRLLPFGGQ